MLKQPSLFPGLTRSGRTSSQGQVIVDGWSSEIGSGKWKVTIESERKSILARTGNWQDDENQSWKIRTNVLSRTGDVWWLIKWKWKWEWYGHYYFICEAEHYIHTHFFLQELTWPDRKNRLNGWKRWMLKVVLCLNKPTKNFEGVGPGWFQYGKGVLGLLR